ncbi:Uncharacterised protein [Mycobacteroides abscessus subsp. abscessus]|nr:Uncharacterised protein [Mycobacteroides abscessus subsp. abscessus]
MPHIAIRDIQRIGRVRLLTTAIHGCLPALRPRKGVVLIVVKVPPNGRLQGIKQSCAARLGAIPLLDVKQFPDKFKVQTIATRHLAQRIDQFRSER